MDMSEDKGAQWLWRRVERNRRESSEVLLVPFEREDNRNDGFRGNCNGSRIAPVQLLVHFGLKVRGKTGRLSSQIEDAGGFGRFLVASAPICQLRTGRSDYMNAPDPRMVVETVSPSSARESSWRPYWTNRRERSEILFPTFEREEDGNGNFRGTGGRRRIHPVALLGELCLRIQWTRGGLSSQIEDAGGFGRFLVASAPICQLLQGRADCMNAPDPRMGAEVSSWPPCAAGNSQCETVSPPSVRPSSSFIAIQEDAVGANGSGDATSEDGTICPQESLKKKEQKGTMPVRWWRWCEKNGRESSEVSPATLETEDEGNNGFSGTSGGLRIHPVELLREFCLRIQGKRGLLSSQIEDAGGLGGFLVASAPIRQLFKGPADCINASHPRMFGCRIILRFL
ncbi:hypothetical protein HK102_000258 [Quaeritorhiza haematococci]|nr:hypothetical protein HK102_000258 [Quaeritorhiza haematococci]